MPDKSAPAPKQQLLAFFAALERELEKVEFFRPPDKRETMQINLRNIFSRMQPTQQDIQTLHGVIMSIAEGRKGPARGGVLDGEEAEMLRELLAEHGAGRVPKERGPVRGLARLLRRNPTEAERLLWQALTNDRRFAGRGFKRQTPIGQHICDFVSFPLRLVIEIVPAEKSEAFETARRERHAWLAAHDYRIVEVLATEIESDMPAALARIDRSHRLNWNCFQFETAKCPRALLMRGRSHIKVSIMQLRNSTSRYGAIPQAVHWLTALFVICGWLLGQFGDDLPRGPVRDFGFLVHMTLGQCVLALLVIRLIWRFVNPPPPPEVTPFGRLTEIAAKAEPLRALRAARRGAVSRHHRAAQARSRSADLRHLEFCLTVAGRSRDRQTDARVARLSGGRAVDPRRHSRLRRDRAPSRVARPHADAHAARRAVIGTLAIAGVTASSL